MARPSTSRVSWVLLVVVLAAFAVGAAASILLSAPSATPAPGPSPLLIVYVTPIWMTIGSVAVFAFFIGYLVYLRWSNGPSRGNQRLVVTCLMVILLAVLFLIFARAAGLGPISAPPGNDGGGGHTGSNQTPTHGANLTGPGGVLVNLPGFPLWFPFVIVAAIALVVVFIVLPGVRGFAADRRRAAEAARAAKAAGSVRDALRTASGQLDLGADPREVILALYAALLRRLQPMVLQLEVSTPEEIRAWHLVRLGVRPEAARTLTRLFEEARYSTHPMGAEAAHRAREAVRATIADLDSRNFAA